MLETLLRALFRALALPLRLLVRRQARRAIAAAEAQPYASRVPGMRLEGALPARLIGQPSIPQIADFARWRAPSYIDPMTWETADNLAGLLSGRLQVAPLTEERAARWLLRTPTAYLAQWEDGRWCIDFRRTALYAHRRVTVHRAFVDPERGSVAIEDADGRVHRAGEAAFPAALAHLVAWGSVYTVAGLHNWVHFHLPCTMVEAHAKLTRQDSVLARFLAPHVRFTARISYAGLWENRSSNNPPGWRGALRPWAATPTYAGDFQRGVAENTQLHYGDVAEHYALPEAFDARVPYLASLAAWYPAFERFVQAIDPHIDDSDWAELVRGLEVALPGIRAIPRVRVLASFGWQVGVVHGTDHQSFVEAIGDSAIYWAPEQIQAGYEADRAPLLQRWKARNIQAVFVRYNANPALKNHLVDVQNYGLDGPLEEAALEFRRDLRAIAADLERRDLLIIPPERLPQSVCF